MGVLKTQSTLTIAVWSSLLLHTAGFLGFGLAFSNKSKPFPKPEPRAVTFLSIGSASEPISTADQELPGSNISPKIIKKIVPDELEPIKKELPIIQSEENPTPDFISDYVESNNPGSISDRSLNQEISAGNDVAEDVPEIKEPVPVETITPVYPFRARKKGFEGLVTLEVVVSDTGNPLSCLIINSSGFKDLDNAAVKTVLASLFHPGTVDGEDVQSILSILIKFQLEDS